MGPWWFSWFLQLHWYSHAKSVIKTWRLVLSLWYSRLLWQCDLYDDIVLICQLDASQFVLECHKNVIMFWWDEEFIMLKQSSVEACNNWKALGKPRHEPIFIKRQSTRLSYCQCIWENQRLETALIQKNGNAFWKCWRSKFEIINTCSEVDHCVDDVTIADNFVQPIPHSHFSHKTFCLNLDSWMFQIHLTKSTFWLRCQHHRLSELPQALTWSRRATAGQQSQSIKYFPKPTNNHKIYYVIFFSKLTQQ